MNLQQILLDLDHLIGWRNKELTKAKFLVLAAKDKEEEKYLCRAWCMVMYAHCDNFLKEASKLYINFQKHIQNNNFEYVWFAFRGKEFITNGNEKKYKSMNEFVNNKNTVIEFPEDEIFKQRSFEYKLLRFLCDWVLNIDFEHKKLMNFCNNLKSNRDKIAHGEENYVDRETCETLHEQTINFLNEFKDNLTKHIRNCKIP